MNDPTMADVARGDQPVTLAHLIAVRAACGDLTRRRGDFHAIATAHFIFSCSPESLAAQYESGGWRTVKANALAVAGGYTSVDVERMAAEVSSKLEANP